MSRKKLGNTVVSITESPPPSDERPLHVRLRPKTLDDVIGQDPVVASLRTLLKERVPHTFLFTGPSGTGKTTLARIIASQLGIEQSEITEIDAATHTGVDEVRELTSTMQYAGFGESGKRLVILDECHSLTPNAWKALLKATEEPPAHVYYVFCTTDPEKVPRTIQTRAITYALKPVKDDDLADYLILVAEAEKIDVDEDMCVLAARRADGSPRMALVYLAMLNKCESLDAAKILLEAAHDNPDVINFIRSMIEKKITWRNAMQFMRSTDMQPESVRLTVVNYLQATLSNTTDDKKAIRLLEILERFAEPYRQNEKFAPLYLSIGRVIYGE
jgi:DNA polymerase III gamma/tau subunit